MTVQEAIKHYQYGITHDIFKEPVTTYAKLSVEALEKQMPKKPIPVFTSFKCPLCGNTDIRYFNEFGVYEKTNTVQNVDRN